MENLQNAVSKINSQKVFSLEEAQEILLADEPPGIEPVVYCLEAVDAVIYPCPFGYIFVYEKQILLIQTVVDWRRGFDASALFQKGYDLVDRLPEGISVIPFDIIDME